MMLIVTNFMFNNSYQVISCVGNDGHDLSVPIIIIQTLTTKINIVEYSAI